MIVQFIQLTKQFEVYMNYDKLSVKMTQNGIDKINNIEYLPLRSIILNYINNIKMINPTFTLRIKSTGIECNSNATDTPLSFYDDQLVEKINNSNAYAIHNFYMNNIRYASFNDKEYSFANNCALQVYSSFDHYGFYREVAEKLLTHIRNTYFRGISTRRSSRYKKIHNFLRNKQNITFMERMIFAFLDDTNNEPLTSKYDFFYKLINKIIEEQKI